MGAPGALARALKGDGAMGGPQKARDGAQEGRLAGAIGPPEPEAAAGGKLERDACEDEPLTAPTGEVADLEVDHARLPPR